jgi:alanine racemase
MMGILRRGQDHFIPARSFELVADESRLRNPHLIAEIDLRIVRHNVEVIRKTTGVSVLPVVKADAYGLGIRRVSEAIADLADGFCVFSASEAVAVNLAHRTNRRVLALGPPESNDPTDYITHCITPTVCNPQQARQLRRAQPALCVDTGMQRFSCPAEDCREALTAGDCREVFTHAVELRQVEQLMDVTSGCDLPRHAAASGLLHEALAALDAVRPGLAMYKGATNISARIVEIRQSRGPAGYSGFTAERHGIILVGYSHGLRRGPCFINGRKSRVLEVGMQTAFVELDAEDRVGDRVVLLGDGLTEADLAQNWNCGAHEVLTALSSAATRHYIQ